MSTSYYLRNRKRLVPVLLATIALWMYLGQFHSDAELERFLASDTTDQHEWVYRTHDCKAFSLELSLSGLARGKLVWPVPADWGLHVRCMTLVNWRPTWVEPQTDEYWPTW